MYSRIPEKLRDEVRDLVDGAVEAPTQELWYVLLEDLGSKEDIFLFRGHAGFTSELIWFVLRYQPDLEPYQRERVAGFVAISALLSYIVSEPGSGVHLGRELVRIGIIKRDDFDVDSEKYQQLTVEETHALLLAMGFTDQEIIRSSRLILGGEFDLITSHVPGRRTPVRMITPGENPYKWELRSRRPFHQLIEACGYPEWQYGYYCP